MSVQIEIAKYSHSFSLKNKIGRLIWNICYWVLFRPFNLFIFNGWRILILKIFGAKIGKGSIIHASTKIWAPWNLSVGSYTCLGPEVDCYNQGLITIGSNSTVSQKSYLCASSHNISDPIMNLVLKPIEIEDQVWVAADAFVGPGVKIGEGAVVGARSSVFKNVEPWTVVGGNPAEYIKVRTLNNPKNGI